MKIVCIIPARLDSNRFPRKIFAKLSGKTLLENVIESAKKVTLFDRVIVAGCSQEVVDVAFAHGVEGVLTDPMIPNGTIRIISAIEKLAIKGDIFVNWQADEPFITEELIETLLQVNDHSDAFTLKKKIDKESASDPNIVKVVTDLSGKALYFSRAPIPYQRGKEADYYKHIGLYAFTSRALDIIKTLKQAPLEECEVLEQLRWLEHGMNIQVSCSQLDVMGIDTQEDLVKANNRTV